ncbi:MAG TPA: DUF1616 domain-containing protein [Candidatus Thermoplasmatota archaeon]|nr:DUF1616 domain-containing protein [Candidatus Thermoplasmatota archaeon]
MILELLRLALALALLVVLPGVVLVNALFPAPRSTLTRLERGYLAVAGGILLLMLVGIVLGFLPHGNGRGWFRTFSSGFPLVEVVTLALSGLLFWVGLQRGAYPRLSARYPALAAAGAPRPMRERPL